MTRRARTTFFLLLACAACSSTATAQVDRPFAFVGPAFVAVRTGDDEATARWYRELFSLEEVNSIDAPDGRYSIRVLADVQLWVEVIRSVEAVAAGDGHQGLFKVGLFVDDAGEAHRWLRERGVETDDSVFVDDALNARSFVFRDLDGNRIQIFERCGGPCR